MKDLDMNELMRYGFAGAAFFVFLRLVYIVPMLYLEAETNAALVTVGLLIVGLTVGSAIYSVHRSVLYPIFYRLFARLNKRNGDTLELDIIRWKNASKSRSLQPKMGEWAAQVHFLYCLSWSGFLAILVGYLACWKMTGSLCHVFIISIIFLCCGCWHHYRYQKWEKRVFKEDFYLL